MLQKEKRERSKKKKKKWQPNADIFKDSLGGQRKRNLL